MKHNCEPNNVAGADAEAARVFILRDLIRAAQLFRSVL